MTKPTTTENKSKKTEKKLSTQELIINRAIGILKAPFVPYQPKPKVQYSDIQYKLKQSSTTGLPTYINKKESEIKSYTKEQVDEIIKNDKKNLLIIDDLIYDCTEWTKKHPGGHEIIQEYTGSDCTEQFFAFHRPRVANRLESLLFGKLDKKREIKQTEKQYKALREHLWENGYFKSSDAYYNKKYWCLCVLFIVAFILTYFQQVVLGAIVLGIFIMQSAYIAHDSMHYGINEQKPMSNFNLHGMFFGSVIFGISADMWNVEHTMHHAITRRPMEDPQFNYLPFFLISEKEITWKGYKLDPIKRFLISIQQYTYIPLASLVGRFNLYLISVVHIIKTSQYLNLLFMAIYFLWYVNFVSMVESKFDKWVFVLLNHFTVGILHVQLLINHLAVEAFTKEEEQSMDFFTFQLKTTRNVTTEWFSHWFHGGLQWQIEHHVFPQLPRHNLRLITPVIKEICSQNKLDYKTDWFFNTVFKATNGLKDLAVLLIKGDLG